MAGSLGLRGLAHDQLLASHDLPGIILARPLIGLLAENGQSKLEWFQKKLLDARIVPKLENTGCFHFLNEMALLVGHSGQNMALQRPEPKNGTSSIPHCFTSVVLMSVEQK